MPQRGRESGRQHRNSDIVTDFALAITGDESKTATGAGLRQSEGLSERREWRRSIKKGTGIESAGDRRARPAAPNASSEGAKGAATTMMTQ